MASNLALGVAKVESGVEVCLFTLARWQLRLALVYCLTSRLMLGQANQAVMSRWVAFIPGVEVCLFTLARWQLRHALVNCLTSRLMLGQTNRAVIAAGLLSSLGVTWSVDCRTPDDAWMGVPWVCACQLRYHIRG